MEKYIGLDVHAASTTFAVIGESGRRLTSHVVETHGQALVEQLKTIPGNKHVCLEEGTQSAWHGWDRVGSESVSRTLHVDGDGERGSATHPATGRTGS